MEESENLAALKKAYTEMILNMAREAAARVAEADSRAASFHLDLCFARDEAVRMLLKLKRMLDVKTVEAETTVAKKQEQIMELEAQLEEAESKILDLRMELESVQDELEVEKAKNNVQRSEENKSSSNGDLPDHHLNSFEPIVPYFSDSELENAANRDIKDRIVNGSETVQMSCHGINPVRQMADPGLVGAVGQKIDLATMIMGRKEPKLYTYGCTQIVGAFEGRILQGTLGCELNCGTHDKGENFSQSQDVEIAKVLPSQKLERPAIMRKKQRKATLGKKSKSTPIPVHAKQWRRQHLVSSLSLCKSYSTKNGTDWDKGFLTDQMRSVHDFDVLESPLTLQKRLQSGELNTIEGKAVKHKGRRRARRRKNLNNSFQFPSNQFNITESSGFCLGPARPVDGKTKSKEPDGLGIINGKKYEGSRGSGVFAKEEDGVEDYSVSAKHVDDIATNNVLVPYEESEPGSNSVNSDADLGRNVQEDGRSVQSDDNRLVKYMFQRKRKRAFVINDSENKAPLGTTVKKQAGDTMKSRLVSKGCKAMKEPSRDSRRLAQVARLLIALSGK